MSDLISRPAAIDALGEKPLAWTEGEYELGLQNQWQSDVDALKDLPSAQTEIIRCKDCKHKPYPSNDYDHNKRDRGFEIIFPDYRCPCRCEDEFYNHIPDDDWFCGNAERIEEV